MTDQKPSLSQRLQPLLQRLKPLMQQAKRLSARGWVLARHWFGIAARETWIVLKRLPIASYSFARAMADANYAHRLTDLYIDGASSLSAAAAAKQPAPAPQPVAVLQDAGPDSALVLLSLLQKEGRFLDFLQEEVSSYGDHEVGAAARVVHEGCQRVLNDHLSIAPVRTEAEGSTVTLNKGFDPAAERPTGQVVGEPPFTGALVHRGWRAVEVRLPQVASSHDVRILAPAEVEL
ncbi:DUF2760 domain-containing protein [Lamprobacter modestohalophilus]|nr:DUF2760 domain-containing protein [Lamprobacter modestohalophilus]